MPLYFLICPLQELHNSIYCCSFATHVIMNRPSGYRFSLSTIILLIAPPSPSLCFFPSLSSLARLQILKSISHSFSLFMPFFPPSFFFFPNRSQVSKLMNVMAVVFFSVIHELCIHSSSNCDCKKNVNTVSMEVTIFRLADS